MGVGGHVLLPRAQGGGVGVADGDVKLWRGLPWWRKEERADVCPPGPRKVKLSNENLTSQEALTF